MNISKLGAVLITGALSFGYFSPSASAASPMTRMFLENLAPNVDFLDRSSRMALDNSRSIRLREFARGEAVDQTNAANVLYDYTSGIKKSEVAAQDSDEGLLTGRSVALDGQAQPIVDNRLPLGQEDLNSLEGLTGGEFDDQYKTKQLDALRQIESDYEG